MNLLTRLSTLASPLAVAAACMLLLQGCGSRGARSRQVPDDAALPVVRALVASVGAGNREYFESKFDSSAFIGRVTESARLSGLEGALARFAMMDEISIGDNIVSDLEDGGSYTFLRLHTVDGETRALVRVITPSGELKYHDIVLGYRAGSDDIVVKDVFLYDVGDLFSHTLASLLQSALEEEGGDDSEGALSMAIDSMAALSGRDDYAGIASIYRSLSPADRARKITLWAYLIFCTDSSLEYYKGAIDQYLAHHPHDTGAVMLRFKRAMLSENRVATIAAIDTLGRVVGGDPYLDYLRGGIMVAMGDTTGGAALMKKAIDAEPEFAAIYWRYLDILITQGRHADARDLLLAMESKAGLTRKEIGGTLLDQSSSAYVRFRRSREYGAWEKGEVGRGEVRSSESGVGSRKN